MGARPAFQIRASGAVHAPAFERGAHLFRQISHLDWLTDPHPVAVDVDATGTTSTVACDHHDHRSHLSRASKSVATFPVVSLSEDALARAAGAAAKPWRWGKCRPSLPEYLDGDALPGHGEIADDDDDGVSCLACARVLVQRRRSRSAANGSS